MAEMSETSETYVRAIADQPFYIDSDIVDDALVDTIWQDLDGLVSRERIREIACEVAATYQDASVTTLMPIFVRRRTKEILALRRK